MSVEKYPHFYGRMNSNSNFPIRPIERCSCHVTRLASHCHCSLISCYEHSHNSTAFRQREAELIIHIHFVKQTSFPENVGTMFLNIIEMFRYFNSNCS